jgi:stage IV sporulation protein B
LQNNISSDYKIKKGDSLVINTKVPVTAEFGGVELSQSKALSDVGQSYSVDLKAFGIIPFTTVNVEVVDEMYVAVLGSPFGMKLYTEGVLVIELTEVDTANGLKKPAESAGLKLGDYIISVDGKKVTTNEDLSRIVEQSDGKKMNFSVLREKQKIRINVTAEISKETGNYKIGIWVRDSSAGIGTLTFYSPASGIICGLGHGICDEDTGSLLKLDSGEMVNAEIISVEKGAVGSPGQLNGRFGTKTLGEINLNSNAGVYSRLDGKIEFSYLTEVALKNEIKDGDAQILCTVDGEIPKLYSCKIKL